MKFFQTIFVGVFFSTFALVKDVGALDFEKQEQHVIDSMYRATQRIHSEGKPPKTYIIRKTVVTSCGLVSFSSYCPLSDEIFISTDILLPARLSGSKHALSMVVAHEYSHAMMHRHKLERKSQVENELISDCFSGIYFSLSEIKLAKDDILSLFSFILGSGDDKWKSIHHHGFPSQRAVAFSIGYAATQTNRPDIGINECLMSF